MPEGTVTVTIDSIDEVAGADEPRQLQHTI